MTLTDLLRNTAVRLAAMFVALFSGALIVAFLLVYWQAGRFLDRHLVEQLAETRDALMIVASRDGFSSLRNVVQSEAATVRDADTVLLLIDNTGKYLAGNARDIKPFAGTQRIPRDRIPELASRVAYEDEFVSRWSDFEGGHLLVGVSNHDVEAMRGFILTGLGVGIVSMLVMAGLSGLWLAHSTQGRVDIFASTLRAVSRGKLDRRVTLSGRGDDLDQVGQQLNAALDRLSALIARVNQSAAAIAHELRSPIGRVRQKLEKMLETSKAGTPEESALRSAISELDHIVEIVEAILQIGQIRSGARRDRFANVDLALLLTDVAEVYEPVAEEAGLAIECLPPMASMAVLGDRQLLMQMFANLIENAVRHCGAGRTITLSVDEPPEGPVVMVADDGPGIPEEERQRVLEPFARLDQSRTTPGAGLGLSLVAAIAELHGAQLVLADNGPGLAVRLSFPKPLRDG